MSNKKWFITFICGMAAGLILLALFNVATDPFGVFGDRLMDWASYNFTNNPRIAKIEYLEKNHEKYDSYIVGSSKTSSISPLLCNQYFEGASFYNMMVYGADLYNMEQTIYYLGDNYTAKNIILHLGASEIRQYNAKTDDVKQISNPMITGESRFLFYTRLLFNNPKYGIDKLAAYFSDSFMEFNGSAIFVPELGNYNKIVRDKENIINIIDYKNQIGDGGFYHDGSWDNVDISLCLDSVSRIKDYCGENGINLMVISSPTHDKELSYMDLKQLRAYWTGLANITPYWNFSGYNSYSGDPRYFYDQLHYRNSLGAMMLAKIFGDPEAYYGGDFGYYITPENAAEISTKITTPPVEAVNPSDAVPIPILMYHDFTEGATEGISTINTDIFKSQIEGLKVKGYTAIHLSELINYVNGDGTLPEKPMIITFDDGYLSNYLYAYPAIRELGVKTNISVIGWSAGQDTRPDGETPIIPHFGLEEAAEMAASDFVEIASHSFDMHELTEYGFSDREGVLQKLGESDNDYYKALASDKLKFDSLFEEIDTVPVFSYPFGYATLESDRMLKDMGYQATLLTGDMVSSVVKGDPYSLYGLYRINVTNGMTADDITDIIDAGTIKPN